MAGQPQESAAAAADYRATRRDGRECRLLRSSSLTKLDVGINAFKRFVGRAYASMLVDHVDAEMLRSFAQNEAKRVSTRAANRNLDFIRQVLRHAVESGYLKEAPKVKRLYPSEKKRRNCCGVTGSEVPTREEVNQIIAAIAKPMKPTGATTRHGHPIDSGINHNDYSDLLRVLCLTGMRIGEAIHLTWDDIDLDAKVIKIRAGDKNGKFWEPKTESGERRIAIAPEAEKIFRRLSETNRKDDWVFETRRATQVQPHNVARRFKQVCIQLGFVSCFVVHSLRKYWASQVAQHGMDAKVMVKMFGHTDFELILKTYFAQNDDARLVEEASKINFGLDLPNSARRPARSEV